MHLLSRCSAVINGSMDNHTNLIIYSYSASKSLNCNINRKKATTTLGSILEKKLNSPVSVSASLLIKFLCIFLCEQEVVRRVLWSKPLSAHFQHCNIRYEKTDFSKCYRIWILESAEDSGHRWTCNTSTSLEISALSLMTMMMMVMLFVCTQRLENILSKQINVFNLK